MRPAEDGVDCSVTVHHELIRLHRQHVQRRGPQLAVVVLQEGTHGDPRDGSLFRGERVRGDGDDVAQTAVHDARVDLRQHARHHRAGRHAHAHARGHLRVHERGRDRLRRGLGGGVVGIRRGFRDDGRPRGATRAGSIAAIEKRRATVGDGGAESFRGGVGAARSRSGARARGAHGRDDAHREAGHRVRTRVWGEHDPVQREWREGRATCAFG